MDFISIVPSILYKYDGGEESLSFSELSKEYIQDLDDTVKLVEKLIAADDELSIDEGTEFWASYSVIDPDILVAQMKQEIENEEPI